MKRTLELIENYSGEYDSTLLINSLLGLLIIPKENLFDKIPAESFVFLPKWGVNTKSIKHFNQKRNGNLNEPTIKDVIHRLRNSIAHFNITPIQSDGQVSGFTFKDGNIFHADLSLNEIRLLVKNLALFIDNN